MIKSLILYFIWRDEDGTLNVGVDFFLITYQLQKLKVEPVLLHYLSEIRILQGTISTIQMQYLDRDY